MRITHLRRLFLVTQLFNEAESHTGLIMKSSDQAKFAVVVAVCLIGLTVVLKNVLNVPADILSQDIVWYVIIYGIFFVSPYFTTGEKPTEGAAAHRTYDNPWVWSAVVIVVTLAIIAFNAFFVS